MVIKIIVAIFLFFSSLVSTAIYGEANLESGDKKNFFGWAGWFCAVIFGVYLVTIFS